MGLLDGKWDSPSSVSGVKQKKENNRAERQESRPILGQTNNQQKKNNEPKAHQAVTASKWSSERSYGLLAGEYNSSYTRGDEQRREESKTDKRIDDIMKFVDEYMANIEKANYREIRDVIIDYFPAAVKRVGGYYSTKNPEKLTEALNKLVGIVATETFAKSLSKVLDSKVWMDDDECTFNHIWRYIGFILSVTLETSYQVMHDDTIVIYTEQILPRLWEPEISEMTKTIGITKDLALDLSIAIPLIGTEWDMANIRALYGRFLDKMLIHADDNADVLNYEVQGMLFDRVFGKGENALKVIGQYLVSEPKNLDEMETEVQRAVYKEFVKMLYTKLDEVDIGDSAFVFRFVARYRKEHEGQKVLFTTEDATKFENARKGLLKAMEDKSIMDYLA